MILLRRNLTRFEYLPYIGAGDDLNENEEHTGEYQSEYGSPVEYEGNISTPSGHVNQTFYGQDVRYTHTLVMDNPNVEIDERGIIRWKDELYDITAVRRSLNSVSIALKKQTSLEDDPNKVSENVQTAEEYPDEP